MRFRLSRPGLKWLLGGLFVALAIPTAILISASFDQLQTQAAQVFRRDADDFARRIDRRLLEALAKEDRRPVDAYRFVVFGDGGSAPQRTSLSEFPVTGALPGTISYFEVDADGVLSTPLLPGPGVDMRQFGVSDEQETERAALQQVVIDVLAQNRLEVTRPVSQADAEAQGIATLASEESAVSPPPSVRSVDQLRAGGRAEKVEPAAERRITQAVFDSLAGEGAPAPAEQEADALASSDPRVAMRGRIAGRIDAFDVDIEALRFNRLATGHFVLFRNVWPASERLVQGMLIEPSVFMQEMIDDSFDASLPDQVWNVAVEFDGARLADIGAKPVDGTPALASHRMRLSPPFASIELTISAVDLPPGPALPLLQWLSFAIAGVLFVGLFSIYRMLASQIDLNTRQRDFVSAVSHELKTPLTSIRMYSEMLTSGWADDAKKATYYQYILDESERLGRLIDNVLHLARLDRAELSLHVEPTFVAEIVDVMRSKIVSHAERANYDLTVSAEDSVLARQIAVDRDAFMQIMINLVDNAIKYSRDAERQCVEIAIRSSSDGRVTFAVRDFGPGLPKTKLKKLFDLFYRPDDANTRSAPGTGIGLSLVYELTVRMHGEVDVRNLDPGAEFSISLPITR